MRLFEIKELTHDFGGKLIFGNASIMVQDDEHIGLVGPNGCGKSTFLKMLLGEIIPNSWQIETNGKLKIGYLDQYADIPKSYTIYSYLNSVFDELYQLDHQAAQIYESINTLSQDEQFKAIGKAQNILDTLMEQEFYQIDKKIDNVLLGLGFPLEDKDKSVTILSGGQKTKLMLAKVLLQNNDLLILDEPTNFLDMKYIDWLGSYLCRLKGAYIVISHDKMFLNKIAAKIIEIANYTFKSYNGNYDYYLEEKERREEIQLQQHIIQQKFIQRSQQYINSFIGQPIINSKATWLKKMLEQLEKIEKPDEIIKPEFKFQHKKGASKMILNLDKIEVGYNGIPILPPTSLKIDKGEKIIFKGFNGIGKTTLLKTIAGDLSPVSGSFEYGENITSLFLKQEEDYDNNFSSFNKSERKLLGIKKGKQQEITVFEFAKEYCPEKSNGELQRALFSCGLREFQLYARVRTLSGGEMTKLRLCIAIQKPVNLIILDEPTNHLDIYSKEVLLHALDEFQGTVIMTTHDKNFDISWATEEMNLEDLFE